MRIKNNSNSAIIVLHEIYGINQHMEMVCRKFSKAGYDIICPNLIDKEHSFSYEAAEEAYQHFMKNIGFDVALNQVKQAAIEAKQEYQNVYIVGYSIGATIAWLCSNDDNVCDGIIGYYGSRIRDYTYIKPKCPVLLIFADQEKSFNVKETADSLKRENIELHILSGKHGFYDPYSCSYCSSSAEEAEMLINNFLEKIKQGISDA